MADAFFSSSWRILELHSCSGISLATTTAIPEGAGPLSIAGFKYFANRDDPQTDIDSISFRDRMSRVLEAMPQAMLRTVP
jgi:hypothetical protein